MRKIKLGKVVRFYSFSISNRLFAGLYMSLLQILRLDTKRIIQLYLNEKSHESG